MSASGCPAPGALTDAHAAENGSAGKGTGQIHAERKQEVITISKGRTYELTEYRNIIMNGICGSEELVKLLGCEKEEHPEERIPYRYSFPHEYIPDAFTGTERYLNFDISASLDPANHTFRNVTICFYVMCHEASVRYGEDGQICLWYDRVTGELDRMLCEKNILGIGRTILSSDEPYSPHNKFKGRLLKFTAKDFSNGIKNGKQEKSS